MIEFCIHSASELNADHMTVFDHMTCWGFIKCCMKSLLIRSRVGFSFEEFNHFTENWCDMQNYDFMGYCFLSLHHLVSHTNLWFKLDCFDDCVQFKQFIMVAIYGVKTFCATRIIHVLMWCCELLISMWDWHGGTVTGLVSGMQNFTWWGRPHERILRTTCPLCGVSAGLVDSLYSGFVKLNFNADSCAVLKIRTICLAPDLWKWLGLVNSCFTMPTRPMEFNRYCLKVRSHYVHFSISLHVSLRVRVRWKINL